MLLFVEKLFNDNVLELKEYMSCQYVPPVGETAVINTQLTQSNLSRLTHSCPTHFLPSLHRALEIQFLQASKQLIIETFNYMRSPTSPVCREPQAGFL